MNKLSIGEAAKYVGVSRDTLRRWEKKGKITPKRSPSNRRYYTKDELDALLKKPKAASKKEPAASGSSSESLRLVIYSLAALVIAVILALLAQVYLF